MKSFRRVRLMSFLLMALMTFSLTANTTPISAAESERNNGVKVMDRVRLAEKNRQKFLGDYQSLLTRTDPDLIAMKERLVYGEIVERGTLNDHQRMLVTLVALAASRTLEEMKIQTEAALRVGLSPVEIKEALYQCAPYMGSPERKARFAWSMKPSSKRASPCLWKVRPRSRKKAASGMV